MLAERLVLRVAVSRWLFLWRRCWAACFTAWSDFGVLQSPKQRVLPCRQRMSTRRACATPLRLRRRAKRSKTNARQQPCAFGHWCAARCCRVNAFIGTAAAGPVAVVPCGNAYVSSTMEPGLLRPGLRSPVNLLSHGQDKMPERSPPHMFGS